MLSNSILSAKDTSAFRLHAVCTKAEFDRSKDKFNKDCHRGDVISISDLNSRFVYLEDNEWTELAAVIVPDSHTTAHNTVKITNCVSCNAPLNLYRVSESGACQCEYCGNWNLVY